jgi:hypothetical protein
MQVLGSAANAVLNQTVPPSDYPNIPVLSASQPASYFNGRQIIRLSSTNVATLVQGTIGTVYAAVFLAGLGAIVAFPSVPAAVMVGGVSTILGGCGAVGFCGFAGYWWIKGRKMMDNYAAIKALKQQGQEDEYKNELTT